MCLIVFDWQPHAAPGAPLLRLAANRDEYFARPAAPVAFWQDAPDILAGRDLREGGTWLGLTRSGRFAALTNVREPGAVRAAAPSRGALVADFLLDTNVSPLDYLHRLRRRGDRYNGYNLLVGDLPARMLCHDSNRNAPGASGPVAVTPGIHGLSNALLDTPWPKLVSQCMRFSALLPGQAKAAGTASTAGIAGTADATPLLERMLDLMSDRSVAADHELPATGLPLERERALSAAFIDTPSYGTRSTIALLATSEGAILLEQCDDDGTGRPPVRPPALRGRHVLSFPAALSC